MLSHAPYDKKRSRPRVNNSVPLISFSLYYFLLGLFEIKFLSASGLHKLHKKSSYGRRKRVKEIIKHRRYNPFKMRNDIALMRLRTPADMSAGVSTVCLPTPGASLPPGRKCIATGMKILNL